MDSKLYYEAHVTVDPLDDSGMEAFARICERHQFRVAKLLMKKGAGLEPSDLDSFCTTRDRNYENIASRTICLARECRRNGIHVRRYKIEDTMLDSHTDDVFGLLEKR